MSEARKAVGKLKWLASAGGLILLVGLIMTTINGVAGTIIAVLGIVTMLVAGYFAYEFGKVGA